MEMQYIAIYSVKTQAKAILNSQPIFYKIYFYFLFLPICMFFCVCVWHVHVDVRGGQR